MSHNFRKFDGKKVPQWLRDLKGKSGCYIIQGTGTFSSVLYVGESHTCGLYKTLLRHFQRWSGKTAGPTFKRDEVEICVIKTRAQNAAEIQNALIAEFRPKFNVEGKPGWFK